MRFICLFVAVIVLYLSPTSHSYANSSFKAAELQAHINAISEQSIVYAREMQRANTYERLSETTFIVTDEVPSARIAYSSHDETRLVHISEDFIQYLYDFVMTESLFDMANRQVLFENAVTDIVLHELGHHALEAFYTDYTPPQYIPMMEQKAQQWAENMKTNLALDEYGTGKVLVLITLLAHALESETSNEWTVRSVQQKLDFVCMETFSQIAEKLCSKAFNTVYTSNTSDSQ